LGNSVFAVNAHASGQQLLASLNINDSVKAERSLLDIANAGDSNAQLAMARIYESQNNPEQNNGLIAEWYRKSAINGNAEAQFQLGLLYIDGELSDGDRETGLFWVELAAEQGHFRAKIVQESLEEEEFSIGC